MTKVVKISYAELTSRAKDLRRRRIPLSEVKPGDLFMTASGTYVLMSQYGDSDRRLKGYIVGTGESYWPENEEPIVTLCDEIGAVNENETDQPQAQLDTALDDTHRRALIMVLRQLHRAWVRSQPVGDEQMSDALVVARFVWPDEFAEAVRDDETEERE